MKPTYSIHELAEILDQEIYKVASGLVAADVPVFHNGSKVDLADFECFRSSYNEENIFVTFGGKPRADKYSIIVSTAALPAIWIKCIENSLSIDNTNDIAESAIGSSTPRIDNSPTYGDRTYLSNNLTTLNKAARKWWANADRDDRATHPKTAAVVAWLVQQGFSNKTAEAGATIIRPEWAPTGRRPEE